MDDQDDYPYRSRPHSLPRTASPGPERWRQAGFADPDFGDGQHEQMSCPPDVDHPADKYDVFREAKESYRTEDYHGGPPDSTYNEEYDAYKDKEKDAAQSRKNYTEHIDTATKPPNPADFDTIGNQPIETKDWHDEAGDKADAAAEDFQAVADMRQDYLEDYVGYHQPGYHKGHKTAIESYQQGADNFTEKAEGHRNWQSMTDQIAESRARKNRGD